MLSKERQLPSPLTSSVHLSLDANQEVKVRYPWTGMRLESELRAAVHEKDVAQMRRLAEKFSRERHYEHAVATLIHEYAEKKDTERCALVLKHVATHATPMLEFWIAMSFQEAPMLRWIGQHDDLARYIFLPMPCPNREWCIQHKVDRNNPGPPFFQWWSQHNDALRQGVDDHLRVEWLRRFTAQPKLYYLLREPTREQAVFVATRPEAIWDMPVLAKYYTDIASVHGVTHSLYEGIAARKKMGEYFTQSNDPGLDIYDLPI